MDEPTAALSRHEVDQLFLVVDDLRKRGVAMMFVGHRMEEIYEVSDRVASGKAVPSETTGRLFWARGYCDARKREFVCFRKSQFRQCEKQ